MIQLARFSEKAAVAAHEGTILGANVLPEGTRAPFRHFYGYLENGHAMAGHSHPTDEIYHILRGSGTVVVGGLCRDVTQGDVVVIPAGVWHTQICRDGGPYLWAAYWWEVVPEGRQVPTDRIVVGRFDKETAVPAHEGSILAADVLPEGLTAPFGHAYGCLEPGGAMAGHRHPTTEIYVVCSGTGVIGIDGEEAVLAPGDVVTIPPDAWHTLRDDGTEDLVWFAFWWDQP